MCNLKTFVHLLVVHIRMNLKKIIAFGSLFEASKILIISSHGNAAVECGFSLNSYANRKFAWKFSRSTKASF